MQLPKFFVELNTECGDNNKIEAFDKKCIVNRDLVKKYFEHPTNIEVRKMCAKKKKRQAKEDEETNASDYNWEECTN